MASAAFAVVMSLPSATAPVVEKPPGAVMAPSASFVNTPLFTHQPIDPYPYAFFNLALAILVGLQGPLIVMSQNRQARKDRARADTDFKVNLKNEVNIETLLRELSEFRAEVMTREEGTRTTLPDTGTKVAGCSACAKADGASSSAARMTVRCGHTMEAADGMIPVLADLSDEKRAREAKPVVSIRSARRARLPTERCTRAGSP